VAGAARRFGGGDEAGDRIALRRRRAGEAGADRVQALGRDPGGPRRVVDVEDGQRAGLVAGVRALVAGQATRDQHVARRALEVGEGGGGGGSGPDVRITDSRSVGEERRRQGRGDERGRVRHDVESVPRWPRAATPAIVAAC
jgi:hypothetical protein